MKNGNDESLGDGIERACSFFFWRDQTCGWFRWMRERGLHSTRHFEERIYSSSYQAEEEYDVGFVEEHLFKER